MTTLSQRVAQRLANRLAGRGIHYGWVVVAAATTN